MAMQKLGWDQVAVDYQDYLSEAQEYADIIADNFEDIRPNINIKNTNDYKNNFDYTTIRNTNSYKKFSLKKQTYNNQMSNLKENDTLDSNFKETT